MHSENDVGVERNKRKEGRRWGYERDKRKGCRMKINKSFPVEFQWAFRPVEVT